MGHQANTTTQAAGRAHGKLPDAQEAAGRKGFKAELDTLRERMRSLGLPHDEIAAEIGRRHRARPREAFRLAWGWTLEQAAARFNGHAATRDADPEARASLTSSRLSEYEHWPRSTRKPSAYVLAMLAEIYETDVLCLLDLSDHESLPQQDRLVLMRRPRAETLCRPRAQVVADDDEPGNAAVSRLVSGGLWLSLPYVPGRLVIEVSGPAGDTAQLAGCADGDTVAGGRLVLLRGAGAGEAGTEAAGA